MTRTKQMALIVFLIMMPVPASAASFQMGNTIRVNPNGNAYAMGNLVQVMKEIKGDVFLAGETVQINNKVREDAFLAADNVVIDDVIGDDLHTFGSSVSINKSILGDAIVFGQKVIIAPDARISGSSIIGAQQAILQGKFDKDVRVMAKNAILEGTYYNDVRANIGNSLSVNENANIHGNLVLSAPPGAKISIPEGVVQGKIKKTLIGNDSSKKGIIGFIVGLRLLSFLSRLLIGALIIILVRSFAIKFASPSMSGQKTKRSKLPKNYYSRLFGYGLLSALAMPILAFIFFIPVITIPLSLIMFVTWGTLVYFGAVLSGLVVAQLLFPPDNTEKSIKIFGRFTIGTLILMLIRMVPVFGMLVYMIMVLVSMGALVLFYKNAWAKLRRSRLI